MEPNYVYILDFTLGILNIIHLTPEEVKASENYDSFDDFLQTLEDKYDFRVSDCQWMCSKDLDIYRYENGEEISHIVEQ